MNQQADFLNVLGSIYKWRKKIILTSIIAGLISIVCVLTLDDYFEAATVFYAASPDLANPSPVGQKTTKSFVYGSGEDRDRLFSVANSAEIANFLISKYKLYNHYDIDSLSPKGKHKMRLKLNKRFKTIKTKYGALELSVEDTDPVLASHMANDARNKIDEITQMLTKTSQQKTIFALEENINAKQLKFQLLIDSLNNIRKKYSIYNTKTQGEVFAQQITKTEGEIAALKSKLSAFEITEYKKDSINFLNSIIKGQMSYLVNLKKNAAVFNSGIAELISLEREQSDFGKQLNLDKERYRQLLGSFNSSFSALHVIEEAQVPLIKSRPKRSIIVLAAIFGAFILSVIIILLLEYYKSINWKQLDKNA